ncbi:MAG: insulinase family protein [Rhodobacterales bacterium]|nr:insulinase family protein [Rhodobacterales bacterium]
MTLGLGLLVGLALLLAALPARAGVFNPETFTLKNGMAVVVVPNHRMPVVNHMVWYRVGSADEPQGKSGIAHFLEHLMFKGTTKYPGGTFSAAVSRNGGRENAFTSYDYTAFHQTVAKDRLPDMMRMESDRMRHLTLTPQDVEMERQVILEERRQRTDNRPSGILAEHVDAALFLNHPYRRPVIGWEHEIRGLTIPDIKAFYDHWYQPENAILVVAGDITAAELKPLAEATYGAIPRGPGPVRARPTEPPQQAARTVTLADARVGQPSWNRTYLAPSYVADLAGVGTHDQALALEILAEVLGGGTSSRLYQALVMGQGIAVSAGAYYSPDSQGPAKFLVYASPRPGVAPEALEAAVTAVVQDLLAGGITQDELDKATARMRDDAVFARDSLRTGARVLGTALAIGRSIQDVETWPERISAVTLDQVAAAARAVLHDERAVTSILLRKEAS